MAPEPLLKLDPPPKVSDLLAEVRQRLAKAREDFEASSPAALSSPAPDQQTAIPPLAPPVPAFLEMPASAQETVLPLPGNVTLPEPRIPYPTAPSLNRKQRRALAATKRSPEKARAMRLRGHA